MTRANDCTCDDEIDEDLTVDANGDGASDCADTDCYNVVYDPVTGAYCPEGGGSDLWILAGLAAIVGWVRRRGDSA